MRCDRVRFLYDEYSQGTLPLNTLGRIEDHLAGCPSCRDYYDQNDIIAETLRESIEVAHPGAAYFEELNARVLAALDRPEPDRQAGMIEIPSTQWRRPLWWVGGVAAAALFMVSLVASRQPDKGRDIARLDPQPPKPQPAASRVVQSLAPGQVEPGIQVAQNSAPAPGQTLNKSAMTLNPATIPHYGSPSRDSDRDNETKRIFQAEAEAKIRQVRQKAQESETLPPEVFKQLQLLKIQVIEGGNEDLRRGLRELEQLVNSRISDQDKLDGNPLVKQAKIYVEANDDLRAGRTEDALNKYRHILFIEEASTGKTAECQTIKSPVAIKAALQMADLFYMEWGNFDEARKYYTKCATPEAKEVLTRTEATNVRSQLDRLERYKANNWQALDLLHKVYHGKWNEVRTALKGLIAMPGAGDLLPEAARTIREHMDSSDTAPTLEIALDLYKILEKQAKVEQNVDIRAWLELVLGDLAAAQFQDTREAINHYGQAAASGSSDVAMQARMKLKEMENENWAELLGNRK